MTLVECPICEREVDIDRPDVKKEEDGSDLRVLCPQCGEGFVVARVKHVRAKLKVAQYGYRIDEQGKKTKVQL